MKKMMFLMLTLLIVGAANVNAQVQIGGTNGPDKTAVLDLNGDGGTATGGLALPRVALTDSVSKLNGETPKPGTVVYNTASTLAGEGPYVWRPLAGGSTGGGGLTEIPDLGVTTAKLAANAVTLAKLAANSVDSTKIANGALAGKNLANKTITSEKLRTVQADSGKILRSDGQSVMWVFPGSTPASVGYTDSLYSPGVTNYTKIVARKFTASQPIIVPPNSYVRVKTTGLSNDATWCVAPEPSLIITKYSGQQIVLVRNFLGGYNQITTFSCYTAEN